jgi:hypothetical protein
MGAREIMPVVEEVHLNDIGTVFRVTLYDGEDLLDCSAALDIKIIFQKANGTRVEKDAVFMTDGTDGIIQYVAVDGDINVIGNWKIQGYIQLPSGKWKSNVEKFKVYANI